MRRNGRRAIFVIADQAVYAFGTLAPSVLVANSVTVADFGIYALGLFALQLLLGFSRSVSGEMLLIEAQNGVEADTARTLTQVRGLQVSLMIGCLASLWPILLGANFLLMPLFFIGGCGAGIRELARYRFLSESPQRALALDALILVLSTGLVFCYVDTDAPQPSICLLLVIISGTIAILFSADLFVRTKICDQAAWSRHHVKYGADFFLGSISLQIAVVSVQLTVGPVGVAAMRGAEILLGPARVALSGALAAMMPLVAATPTRPHFARMAMIMSVSVTCGLAAFYVVCEPLGFGARLLGPTWGQARPILPTSMIGIVFASVTAVATVFLKSARASSRLLSCRIAIVLVSLVLVPVAAMYWGIIGVAVAVTTVSAVAATLWSWVAFGALEP